MPRPDPTRYIFRFVVLMGTSVLAQAQPSLCSSDGQPAPTALLERVINADCETCWGDRQTPKTPIGGLTLDWIVPGTRGDSAPLSAAANRDATARLSSRAWPRPVTSSHSTTAITGLPGSALRVAHGLAIGGFVGVSIRLTLEKGATPPQPMQAWVALVEALPAGTEGSPVARNLVRNVLQPIWNMRDTLSTLERTDFWELRPMNLGEGVQAQRVRVAAWLEDAQGQVLTAALSECPAEELP